VASVAGFSQLVYCTIISSMALAVISSLLFVQIVIKHVRNPKKARVFCPGFFVAEISFDF